MKYTIRIQGNEITPELASVERLLGPAGRQELTGTVAQLLVEQGRAAFNQPSLRPSFWPARKDPGDGHPLLKKSGALWQSLTKNVISDRTAVIGSDRLYAAFHQYGTRRTPPRPFFPLTADNELTERAARLVDAAVARKAKSIVRRLPG